MATSRPTTIGFSNGDELYARLNDADAILVPGGFGERGTTGKMRAITYARENKVPYLGICLGMQLAVIEYARNVLHIDANSSEFDRTTAEPIIGLITEWLDERGELQIRSDDSDLGGTMRLGAQQAELVAGSKLSQIYGTKNITERHRHRYEMNNRYIEPLEQAEVVQALADGGFDDAVVQYLGTREELLVRKY